MACAVLVAARFAARRMLAAADRSAANLTGEHLSRCSAVCGYHALRPWQNKKTRVIPEQFSLGTTRVESRAVFAHSSYRTGLVSQPVVLALHRRPQSCRRYRLRIEGLRSLDITLWLRSMSTFPIEAIPSLTSL